MNGIAEMRKNAGMTQQALADALHVDRSTVAKWETGAAFPTGQKLPQVAQALNCEIESLYGKLSNGKKNSKLKKAVRKRSQRVKETNI